MHAYSTEPGIAALSCLRCGTQQRPDHPIDAKGCPACGAVAPSNFELVYTDAALQARKAPLRPPSGSFLRHIDYLPIEAEDLVSLGEGDTPLMAAEKLGSALDIGNLRIKDESRNPTWSHKDRFSAIAVSYARRQGHRFIATASSGNAGASLAAYAAKAGLGCLVVTFKGAAGPMVEQIRRYGALVVELEDKTQRWPLLAEGVRRFGWFVTSPFAAPVVGSNPIGIEGYKTIAYEIIAQSDGGVPDWVVVPMAYGDVLRGIWRGFRDLFDAGHIARLPRMAAAEIHGSIQQSLSAGVDAIPAVQPRWQSQALSIGTLQGSFQSLATIRESGGITAVVEDDALWAMQSNLARMEGLFGELAGVAGLAAAAQLRQRGMIDAGQSVVCVMTASGLKDIDQKPPTSPRVHDGAGDWASFEQMLAEFCPQALVGREG